MKTKATIDICEVKTIMKNRIIFFVLCLLLITSSASADLFMANMTRHVQAITWSVQPGATLTVPNTESIGTVASNSGLTLTYDTTDHSKCTVSGTTLTAVGAGDCYIVASQAGNGHWFAATPTNSAKVTISGGGGACDNTKDYIGDKTAEASNLAGNVDTAYCYHYTTVCGSGCSTGTLDTGYFYHYGTTTNSTNICAYEWTKNDISGGDASATLKGCTGTISSSTDGWKSAAFSGSALTVDTSKTYWICYFNTVTGSWPFLYKTTGPGYIRVCSGCMASPPTDLSGTWVSYNYMMSIYGTIK